MINQGYYYGGRVGAMVLVSDRRRKVTNAPSLKKNGLVGQATDYGALSIFQCLETAGGVTHSASSPKKPVHAANL